MKFLHFHGVQPVYETTYNVGPGLYIFEQYRRYRFILEVPRLIMKEPTFTVQLMRTDGHHYYETDYSTKSVYVTLKEKMDSRHYMLRVSFNVLSSKHNNAVYALKVLLKTDDDTGLVLYTAFSPYFVIVNCAQSSNNRMKRLAFEVLREGQQLSPGLQFQKEMKSALALLSEVDKSKRDTVLTELVEGLKPEDLTVFQQISHLLELKQQPLFVLDDVFF